MKKGRNKIEETAVSQEEEKTDPEREHIKGIHTKTSLVQTVNRTPIICPPEEHAEPYEE